MTEARHVGLTGSERARSSRPSIALCSGSLDFPIPIAFLKSAAAVAAANEMNFLYFVSHPIDSESGFEIQANIFYPMLAEAEIDGLLIASNLLGIYKSLTEVREFFHRAHPVPMVSIGLALDGIPSVVLDNFSGMYASVLHLIETHGYRTIAYLGGPEGNPEAQERYLAYTTALKDCGLRVEPDLVMSGTFLPPSGAKAARKFFDDHQHHIEAVVAANDHMALELILEAQRRGLNVPEDVAIVGFDDISIAHSITPSLSTVSQPFEAIGRQATELLIAQMAGQPVPEVTHVPARLILRQSCGCAATETLQGESPAKISAMLSPPFRETPREFFNQLNQAIYQTAYITVSNIENWNDILSILRDEQRDAQRTCRNDADWPNRTVLGNTMLLSLQEKHAGDVLTRLGERIISTLNVSELMTALEDGLPDLGVRRAYIALYEDPPAYQFPQSVPEWSRLVLAYNEQGPISLPQEGQRFPTHELLPQSFWLSDEPEGLVVEALYVQREQIGFALFEIGAQDVSVYETLRRYLSSSLHGALLVQHVQSHTNELASAYEEIRALNERLSDENLHMRAEMELAKRIQTSLLPSTSKHLHADFEIAAAMLPADEVGGDYYDISFDREGAIWFSIGDVSGHGVTPGLIMMIAQSIHTTLTTSCYTDPRKVIAMLNKILYKNVTGRLRADHFMSFTTLKYLGHGRFQYAGRHLDLIVHRRGSGCCEQIETEGSFLNFIEDISHIIENRECSLEIGDTLILHTDGLTEAMDHEKRLLDINRFKNIITAHAEEEVETLCDSIFHDVLQWCENIREDDMSLLIIRRTK